MWTIKRFHTQAALDAFIEKIQGAYAYNVLYLNNAYGVEYKKLRKVY